MLSFRLGRLGLSVHPSRPRFFKNPVRFASDAAPPYQMIISETKGAVGLVRLNRPAKLNSLCDQLVREMVSALSAHEASPAIGCMVLTGNEKAFAAGADIAEMANLSYVQSGSLFSILSRIREFKKPLIAAVNGFALGGGCELAMLCDIIVAGKESKFGQPEIKLATIPGIGGTQRLTRAVGKSLAMEVVLTGDFYDSLTMLRAGLVSRVVDDANVLPEAMALATKIASMSQPIVALAKASVNQAFETNLTSGLLLERKLFESTFATEDQKEGMKAFVDKKNPTWKNK